MTLIKNAAIIETDFDPQALHHKETIFTLGNGYLGTRGAFEEGYPGEHAITLVHGLFDDVPVVHTELVNVPNWLNLTVLIDGERFRMERGTLLAYRRELNLRTGVLMRDVRWRSPAGHTVDFRFERFASLADPHVLTLRCTVTSLDFAGLVEIRAALPGHVDNAGYMHWEWVNQRLVDGQSVALTVRTRETHQRLSEACHLSVIAASAVRYAVHDCPWSPMVAARARLDPGQSLTADKVVTLFTDHDVDSPEQVALEHLRAACLTGYDGIRAAHEAVWAETWEMCDILIVGDDEADLAVRFSLFQLLCAAPRRGAEDGVAASIPAKTLSGLGYRGHVFWDTEIFMLPLFTYTQPVLARNMLLYRYHTLPGARHKARQNGYEGAMYAWESAATGEETTPRWVPAWIEGMEELVRIWCGDIELHISADVAYAVHQYWQVTGDDAFMCDYGAEIILDTARFWGSRVTWDAARAAYVIHDVIGPDENHEHVNNNAFTNHMVRWNLDVALKVLDWLRETCPDKAVDLEKDLALKPAHLAHWREVIDKLVLGFDPQTGMITQFDGFFGLEDVDWDAYAGRVTSMQALLGIEETQKYQILKQPDVLMLLYLLDTLYPSAVLRVNWDYYTPRTDLSYGSSLGPAIQAALASRVGDIEAAYTHFLLAARTDLLNVRGNAGEGIHGATAGGLWQAVVFGFAGVRPTETGLQATPHLPAHWQRLKFRLKYRGIEYEFDIAPSGPGEK